jgi:hypothetical protein
MKNTKISCEIDHLNALIWLESQRKGAVAEFFMVSSVTFYYGDKLVFFSN